LIAILLTERKTTLPCKTVIFDYIGTLVNCKSYTMAASKEKLFSALLTEGFEVGRDNFFDAYDLAHEKYRKVRYGQLREVTNAVWVSEALCNLGFKVQQDDFHISAALSGFFQDFIDTLELREGAKKLVRQVSERCQIALISNFTYAPVIYKSLKKLEIAKYFSSIVVSEEVNWRKPHPKIFHFSLNKLKVKPEQAIYVGDNPIEDIKGAKQTGLKTLFVPSQFNTLKDLTESKQEPDYIAKNLKVVLKTLNQILLPKEDHNV
jgi:putative hydrolase of the HAD superfamily